MFKSVVLRDQVTELMYERPFQPFVLSMDNGEHIHIDHPGAIMYSTKDGEFDFYAMSRRRRYSGHFDAVNNIQYPTLTTEKPSNGNGHHE